MMVKGLKQKHLYAILEALKWSRASYMEKAQKYLYPNPSDRGAPLVVYPDEGESRNRTLPHRPGVDVAYRDGVYKSTLFDYDEVEAILKKVKK